MVTGQINHSLVIIIGFFSLVNALINPILYGKMSLRYRQGYAYIFKKILSICGAQKPDGSFFGKFLNLRRIIKNKVSLPKILLALLLFDFSAFRAKLYILHKVITKIHDRL